MLQICAWCRKRIGTVPESVHDDDAVSHGICNSCVDNLSFQMGVPLTRYLESLSEPVLVINGEAVVQTANSATGRLLGKPATDAEQRLTGDVFECAYARLPEGCGRTIHCSGCAIRHTVADTYQTGRPHERVPATLNRENPDDPSALSLLITTVKVGDMVLLRIDRMSDDGRKDNP